MTSIEWDSKDDACFVVCDHADRCRDNAVACQHIQYHSRREDCSNGCNNLNVMGESLSPMRGVCVSHRNQSISWVSPSRRMSDVECYALPDDMVGVDLRVRL